MGYVMVLPQPMFLLVHVMILFLFERRLLLHGQCCRNLLKQIFVHLHFAEALFKPTLIIVTVEV